MAKQLNLIGNGQIIPTALHQEMERSYLEYAMSVIVGRALPDARDGLKPVHRRILYAMYELGLVPDRPYRKCARVVGDVLGKYHPHGDQSVYDALVRMVQEFSTRYPLLSGHGNFGSVDNDPPAAMRYTETKLAPIAFEAMLSEIGQATVDFTNNFDNSQQEPVVLPVQLPILLLNGCTGIAVGMATNIPPHNLSEVIDGLIAIVDNPNLTDENLWQLIPGPDFPTGGEIVEISGIREAYRTGRGIFPVRGVATIETIEIGKKRRREGTAIVITELPYQVNKAAWIEKIADLVTQGKLEEISDIRDESDRDGMRVIIELKKDIKPEPVLKKLYHQTALQTNFGAIFLALVNNKPTELSLRQLLNEFLSFRENTLTKQYQHELKESQQRLHIVEGLLNALNNLNIVVQGLCNSADGTIAKLTLQENLAISDSQADSILAMPMRRLTGLEREKLQQEGQDLQKRIQELEKLLNERSELLKALKKELRSFKRKFGDTRRTKIVAPTISETVKEEIVSKEEKNNRQLELSIPREIILPEDAIVVINDRGSIYWQIPQNKNEEPLIWQEAIDTREHLIAVTDNAKAYPVAIKSIPHSNKHPRKNLLSLLPKSVQKEGENTVAQFFLNEKEQNLDLILLTEKGKIKRLSHTELKELGNRGLVLIKLKPEDRLNYLIFGKEGQNLAITTTSGRIIRFAIDDLQLPIMGRAAIGNDALRLRLGEKIIGCNIVSDRDDLLLVSELGYAKRFPTNLLRLGHRGDLGTFAMQFADKTDNLAGVIVGSERDKVLLKTDRDREIILSINSVALWGKDGSGDHSVKLKPQEKITTLKSIVSN